MKGCDNVNNMISCTYYLMRMNTNYYQWVQFKKCEHVYMM